jgi:hypothetical protein
MTAIRLIHGSSDRVTSHLGTLRLFDRLPNADKEVEIYDGYEHSELNPDVAYDSHGKGGQLHDCTNNRLDGMKQMTRRGRGYFQIGGIGSCSGVDMECHM